MDKLKFDGSNKAMADTNVNQSNLKPSDPLPIPTLAFPFAIQSENEKVFSEEDKINALLGKRDQLVEHKPEDPLGAILEKNVTDSRDILAKTVEETTEVSKFYLQHLQTQKIHSILKNHGMDSQQADKALKQIRDTIEG